MKTTTPSAAATLQSFQNKRVYRTPIRMLTEIMKLRSNFQVNAVLGKVICTLSMVFISSHSTVLSAEEIIDIQGSEDVHELEKKIDRIGDVQALIKLAGNAEEFHAQHASIIRLGNLKNAAGAPVLLGLIENPKIREDIRVLAAKSLGQIASPEYFESLLKIAQKEESPEYPLILRQQAAISLCNYDNPKGPELLITKIKESHFDHVGMLDAFDLLKAEDAEKLKDALIENVRSGARGRLAAIYVLGCQPKPDGKSVDALIHAAIREKDENVRQLLFCIMTGSMEHFESFLNVPMRVVVARDAKDKLIAAIPELEKSADTDSSFIFAEVCRLFALLDHPDALAALIRLADSNHKESILAIKALYMNAHADAREFFADTLKNRKFPAEDRIRYLNALNLETYNGKLEKAMPEEIADALLEIVKNEKDEDQEVRKWAILKASNALLPVVDHVIKAIQTTKDPEYKRQLIQSLQFQQNENSITFLKDLIGKEKDDKERWLMIHTAFYLTKWMGEGDQDTATIYEIVAKDESLWLRTKFMEDFGTWRQGHEILPSYFAWLKKEPNAEIREKLVSKLIYSYYGNSATYPFITNELLYTLENDINAQVRKSAASILNGLFINSNQRFTLPDPQPSIARINVMIAKVTDPDMKDDLTEVRDQWEHPQPVRKR